MQLKKTKFFNLNFLLLPDMNFSCSSENFEPLTRKTKVSILFYAKKAKAASNGLVPIYNRITINGKRIELSTNNNFKTFANNKYIVF